MIRVAVVSSVFACTLTCLASAAAPVDGVTVNRIADQGFNHGEVMNLAEYLDDHIGARMTNSPSLRTAEHWTQDQFKSWGLKNVHLEPFDFGRGWWIEYSRVHVIEPRPIEVKEIPIAWTPGTQGAVTAPVVVAPMSSVKDFAEWKGKLSGKIVLISLPAAQKDDMDPPFQRFSESDISKLDHYVEPTNDPELIKRTTDRILFKSKLDKFLSEEGAIAWAQMSRTEGRLVHGEGSEWQVGRTPKLPGFEFGAEDYRRLARLAKTGDVKLEIDSRIHWEDGDHNANDVVAEIPGTDPKAGFVMAGAHLDSWVAGDGAADNGAGSVVIMEAARILATLDLKPSGRCASSCGRAKNKGCWDRRRISIITSPIARRIPIRNWRRISAISLPRVSRSRCCLKPRSWPDTSISIMARGRCVAFTPRATSAWLRSSRSGWRRSPAWAPRP